MSLIITYSLQYYTDKMVEEQIVCPHCKYKIDVLSIPHQTQGSHHFYYCPYCKSLLNIVEGGSPGLDKEGEFAGWKKRFAYFDQN
jgi:DNA-directed RNA polymerase subunit RPC12/RpoP